MEQYDRMLERFDEYLRTRPLTLRLFQNYVSGRKWAPASRAVLYAALRKRAIVRNDVKTLRFLERDVFPHARQEHGGHDRMFLSPGQVRERIDAIMDPRARSVADFLWGTGISISELVALRPEHVSHLDGHSQGTSMVEVHKTPYKQRVVLVPTVIAREVERVFDLPDTARTHLFMPRKGGAYSRKSVWRLLKDYRLTPSLLRNSRLVYEAAVTGNPESARRMGGLTEACNPWFALAREVRGEIVENVLKKHSVEASV